MVDSDPRVLRVVTKHLKEKGYAPTQALDSQDALLKLERVNPRLVVLDLSLPDRSGLDALKSMRKERPELGVILTTGWAVNRLEINLPSLGAFGILSKPLDLAGLEEVIWVSLILSGPQDKPATDVWPEQRGFQRFPVSIPCKLDWRGIRFRGRIHNISFGGAFVTEVGIVPPKGGLINIKFEFLKREVVLGARIKSEVNHTFQATRGKDDIGYLQLAFQKGASEVASLIPIVHALSSSSNRS